jgi:hypothetical protein
MVGSGEVGPGDGGGGDGVLVRRGVECERVSVGVGEVVCGACLLWRLCVRSGIGRGGCEVFLLPRRACST